MSDIIKDPGNFFSLPELSDKDFNLLSKYIEKELGIKMPDTKKIMLESRLQRRLRELNMKDFSKYLDFVFSEKGKETELHLMIDAVTTNKTDFFRESDHFDFLVKKTIPSILTNYQITAANTFNVWSSACSTGEEPYSIAMVLQNYKENNPTFDFRICASDISTKVLQKAVKAVYEAEKADPIPFEYKKKYLLQSKDKNQNEVKIGKTTRDYVDYFRINLMDDLYALDRHFHVIFCRNVIIYFDRPTQEKILKNIISYLLPGGYLFLGHSETLTGMSLKLKSIAPTIYKNI